MNKNSLKKNFSWNFIGNLIYAATQWGLIVVITRLGSVEMVGLFSLGLALTGPIIMFTNLQLRTVQATSHEGLYKIADYFGVRIVTNVAFCLVLSILLLFSDYDIYTMVIVGLVGVTKLIESLSDLLYGFFQQKERMELIAKSTIVRGISSLLIIIISLYFTSNLIVALIGMSVCWLVIFILYDVRNVYRFTVRLRPSFKFTNLLEIIKMSLPLGIVVMIVSLNTNLPRILVEKMLDVEALGYFASISYLVFVGSKFINSMGNAVLPRLALLYNQKNIKDFRNHLLTLVAISSIIGLFLISVSIIGGEYILYYIYGADFYKFKTLLILIMIYGMFNYISYSLMVGLNALRNFKIQPYLGLIWLIFALTSLLYLTPKYGLNGAAIALIIYSVSRILSIGFVLYYTLNRKLDIE